MATWKTIGKVGPPQGLDGSFFLVGEQELAPSGASIVIGDDPLRGLAMGREMKQIILFFEFVEYFN
jgi:hypothetical protein